MGDMADMVLTEVLEMESLRDDYVCGHLTEEEAFAYDFMDPAGIETEGMQTAWDRNPIGTREDLDRQVAELSSLIDSLRGL